ncbi:MAG: MBG domain-containing protein [Treponema sp.]|nr:MBG domain-containing protein [Treponema sp.]
MKKAFKMIIALFAIIGLGMAACDQPTNNNGKITPALADFTITGIGTKTADGTPQAVTIEAKTGKSAGLITVWYEGASGTVYGKSTEAPSGEGTYKVTFDVAAHGNYNAATGLAAGTLIISDGSSVTPVTPVDPVNPVAADFNITIPSGYADGDPKTVTISPKNGKSGGAITVWYEGTNYPKNTNAPSAAGTYAVTFDVAVAEGFNAVTGLNAGTLVIKTAITAPHKIIDFENGWDGSGYAQRQVTWDGYNWMVSGVVTTTDNNDHIEDTKGIRFRGNDTDTGASEHRIELISYLTKIQSISFDYASYGTHSGGIITLYYQTKDSGNWEKAGEVTALAWEGSMENASFDIDKANVRCKIVKSSQSGSTSVNIDNIIIIGEDEDSFDIVKADPVTPTADDFTVSGLDPVYDGGPKAVSIKPRQFMSQGQITVWYEGTNGTSYPKSTDAPSDAGEYKVTFDVAEDEENNFTAATGLEAGTLVITEITDPFILVDFEDAVWAGVPYTGKELTWDGYKWKAVGYSTMDANDRREGARSLRLRGNNAADTGEQTNRLELLDYVNGIKSISFDYGSYSTHSGGTLIVSYMTEDSGEWVEVDRITSIPAWAAGGSVMQKAKFDLNVTEAVRFKIEKPQGGSTNSVNIDNIVITYYEE